jgi:transcription antitermination factor NusG
MVLRTENTTDDGASARSRWYACQVMSRAEKKVARYLDDQGIESFVPLMSVESQWKDRKKIVELPLFRGYLFARFSLDRFGSVLRVPGIATVVRHNGAPAPIADEDIENVRRFAEHLAGAGLEPEPVRQFVEGQRVRILAAPFAGSVEGVVMDLRPGQNVEVFVGVQLIGQFVRIKVRAEDLEPVDSPA